MEQLDNSVIFMAISVILELLTIIAGLYYFNRKFPVEKQTAQADANMDNASANKQLADASAAWLDNHNRMFTMMQERDAEIVQLNKRVLELESLDETREAELQSEKSLRQKAEEENRELRKQVEELRQIVNQLKEEIASLKQASTPVVVTVEATTAKVVQPSTHETETT